MERKAFKNVLIIVIAAILLIFALWNFEIVLSYVNSIGDMLLPIVIGCVIAFILKSPYEFFLKIFKKFFKKSKKGLASKVVSLVLVYILLILILILIPLILVPEFTQSLALFEENLNGYIANTEAFINNIINQIDLEFFADIDIQGMINDVIGVISGAIPSIIDGTLGFTTSLISIVTDIVFGLVISIYLLADKDKLYCQYKKVICAVFKQKRSDKIISLTEESNIVFTKFVKGQLTEAVILGVLCFIGMTIFSFDYAFLISTIIGITCLIPFFGAFIGTIPAVIILFLVEPIQSFWFLVFILILQQLEGNLIYPRVVGTNVGLPPLWVIISLIIWGDLFGVVGMLVGVPLTSIIYEQSRRKVNSILESRKAKKKAAEPPIEKVE